MQIKQLHTTPFYPAGNAVNERSHQSITRILASLVHKDQYTWSDWLPVANFVYNNAIHSSTNESPFFLVHMRDANLSADLLQPHRTFYDADTTFVHSMLKRVDTVRQLTYDTLLAKAATRAKAFNKKAHARTFKPGDKVFLWDDLPARHLSRKLLPLYKGPFRILQMPGPVTARIQWIFPPRPRDIEPRTVHVNKLRLAPALDPAGEPLDKDSYCQSWRSEAGRAAPAGAPTSPPPRDPALSPPPSSAPAPRLIPAREQADRRTRRARRQVEPSDRVLRSHSARPD